MGLRCNFMWFRPKIVVMEVNDLPTDKILQTDDRFHIWQGFRVSIVAFP